MLNRSIVLTIQIAYIVVITVLSLVSIDTKTNINVDFADKIIHVIIHTINVILLYIVFLKFKVAKSLLLAIIVSILYGIIIEILQEYIAINRQFDIFDIYANCFGTIIAAIILKLKGKAIVKLI
ncbi:MAG: VanZ family protein [Flavobacteriaceae bacterium]|nr:VanZ family protein [Flavobacteriaceae bacterium]